MEKDQNPPPFNTLGFATKIRVRYEKYGTKSRENTPHVFSVILFHPFCLLFNNLTLFLWPSLKKTTTPQFNTLYDLLCLLWCFRVRALRFSSTFFPDGKHRNCLNFTPVTLKYFLSFLIFLCLLAPHPLSFFIFLIPSTLHLCNLAPSKLCYFYTLASRACVRAGEWRWCRFPGFFFSFSEHLPPTSPICRHLPRFSPHFSAAITHTAHTNNRMQTHILWKITKSLQSAFGTQKGRD